MASSSSELTSCDVAVVGGGPAGLRAAEVAATAGARVAVFEAKPSAGRKFLVAGRGGLNLTHSEPLDRFVTRYLGGGEERWRALLAECGPGELRAWAAGVGVETFVGSSGRVFPVGKQAAGLLRRWLARLRALGVAFHVNHRWENLRAPDAAGAPWRLTFHSPAVSDPPRVVAAQAVVFALGGASWPATGSDGGWTTVFRSLGVHVTPWQPANCGWEIAAPGWHPAFLAAADGRPLKNVVVRAGASPPGISGELLVTCYGLEGGALYALGAALRALPAAARRLEIDLKPQLTAAALVARLPSTTNTPLDLETVARCWRLSPVARLLLEHHGPGGSAPRAGWLRAVQAFPLPLASPRPLAEAISSAGGVAWSEMDDLMLRRLPGVFLCGEMLDWEAPTGGYLLQGCFATGTRAGRAAAAWAAEAAARPRA